MNPCRAVKVVRISGILSGDTKSQWDNRLLPTNSVYEKNQEFGQAPGNVAPSVSSLNENNVVENSKGVENSSSYEIDNNEEFYDDDYELEDTGVNQEEDKRASQPLGISSDSVNHENKVETRELSAENSTDSLVNHEDDAYYYYDDYENATNPQNEAAEHDIADYFDSSEDAAVSRRPDETRRPLELESSKETSGLRNSSIEESSEMIGTSSLNTSSSGEKIMESHDDEIAHEAPMKLPDNRVEDEKSMGLRDEQILIGEAVVSVVTTKSVVNGTISVPVSSQPITTEQITSPMIPSSTPDPGMIGNGDTSETTEDSRIVASVQTSRSISGARFLPFLVVQAIDKNSDNKNSDDASSLSSHEHTESIDELGKDDKNEEKPASQLSTTTKKSSVPSESTESIIDKLDRVQSELSSGFLANGFRTSGNTLQLDALSEQRPVQTRKTYTTTSKTPVISKFVPRRYNQDKKSTVAATTPAKITEASVNEENDSSTEKVKFRWPSSSRNSRPTSTESNSFNNNNSHKNNNIRAFGSNAAAKTTIRTPIAASQDISAFLPPGYKLKKEDAQVTEKSILGEILAKSKFDISSLLPANYNPSQVEDARENGGETKNNNEKKNVEKNVPEPTDESKSSVSTGNNSDAKKNEGDTRPASNSEKSSKPEKTLQDLFSKASFDISALLPPDYNKFKNRDSIEKSTTTQSESTKEIATLPVSHATTVKSPAGIKLVFPSRPGGRKALPKVSTSTHRAEGSGPVSPKIQKGWPTRATTEFTGWPTPSTTPISIEKLLEAARTATVSSINVSMVTMTQSTSTTSTTTTTTTTTQRPTTPGICEEECEVAGTIRIVGNATWVPELLDRNTKEWQLLAEEIEKEMNLVFSKSSVLRKWYKHVRIDAFSPGSILVDYFIELTDLSQRINTQELKVIFHDSLRTYNSDVWNETLAKGPIRLGKFALDPKSTDFVVIPKVTYPQQIQDDDRLIPQWAIAVIVIGVGGLLFIIVFGVSVLVNRQNAAKLKKPSPVVYTEEVAKNIIQASHAAPSHRSTQDYPKSEISTIWNDTDLWRDKSFESNSNEVLVDGTLDRERNVDRRRGERKYNMYDSWRSEWNGYYYNPSQSSKFAGYESTTNLSRHPPDYDTNF
ncbi:serine-rich adhesin for platelets isoform X2 [Venturia canescens]|uniref:serine-rich adhesin for platelets isoform X2 n=1 Tax=Venturia canescens TaxID=32260 RepID=UPI001C9CAB1C|nr:serine-rich adhesin for platelets isoform X2 [Venturia canescens]